MKKLTYNPKRRTKMQRTTAVFCVALVCLTAVLAIRQVSAWFYTRKAGDNVDITSSPMRVEIAINDKVVSGETAVIDDIVLRAPTVYKEEKTSADADDDQNFDMAAEHIRVKLTNIGQAGIRPSIALTSKFKVGSEYVEMDESYLKFAVAPLSEIKVKDSGGNPLYYPTYKQAIDDNWLKDAESGEFLDDTLTEYNKRLLRNVPALQPAEEMGERGDSFELAVIVWVDKSIIGSEVFSYNSGGAVRLQFQITLKVSALDENAY